MNLSVVVVYCLAASRDDPLTPCLFFHVRDLDRTGSGVVAKSRSITDACTLILIRAVQSSRKHDLCSRVYFQYNIQKKEEAAAVSLAPPCEGRLTQDKKGPIPLPDDDDSKCRSSLRLVSHVVRLQASIQLKWQRMH